MLRVQHPSQTRAEAEAMLARVDAMFDAVFAQADDLVQRSRAAGLLRDPRSRTRAGDPPAAAATDAAA